MDAANTSSWMQLVHQFGLPLVLFFGLVALLIASCVFVVRWLAPRLDQVINAVVELIDGQKEEQRRIGHSLEEIGGELVDVKEQLVGLRGHAEHARAEVTQVISKLDRLLDRAARAT